MDHDTRRENQQHDLRGKILDAARTLFLTKGYAGVSMRIIAREIGYSPTTIYIYFKNKSDLLTELVNEHNQILHAEYRTVIESDIPTLQKLLGMLEAYVRNGLARPDHFRLVSGYYPEIMEVRQERSRGYNNYSEMYKLLDRLKDEGYCRDFDTHLAVRSLWAGVYGITSLMILREDLPWGDREAMGRNVIRTLLQGVLAPGTEIPDPN